MSDEPQPMSGIVDAIKWPSEEEMARRRAEHEAYQRGLREQRFAGLCPPNYRETARDWQAPNQWVPKVDWAAFDAVQGWQYGPMGLLLAGPTRLGKTRSVWQLIRRLMVEEGRSVEAFDAVEFGNEAEKKLQVGRGSFAEWVESLYWPAVLFLDDYGQMRLAGSRDEWVKSQLFGLVEARMSRRKPTFFTTNHTAESLAAEAGGIRGDPLLGRILESCNIITFKRQQERSAE